MNRHYSIWINDCWADGYTLAEAHECWDHRYDVIFARGTEREQRYFHTPTPAPAVGENN